MIPRLLASKANRLLALALFVVLVVLPIAGVHIDTGWQLVGGNFTNVTGYLAASLAAGASVVNLHEGRKHRRAAHEERTAATAHREHERHAAARRERHLAVIRAHLTAGRPPADPPPENTA